MPVDYCSGIICPTHSKHPRECPRSEVYRAIESGNNHAIFGWVFRCRTCDTRFFISERKMAEYGREQGRRTKLREQEERKWA